MEVEIIDLTDSPPSPPRSSKAPRIINFGVVSVEKNQFEKALMPLGACTNPNLHHTNQLQTTLWPVSTHTHDPSEIDFSFQPNVHVNRVATVFEPAPELNTHLFPHGARLKEPWTQREHQLFLMGLIKYGRGHWSKIARDFVCNKTPHQVRRYAGSFFRHLPSTQLHGFRRRKLTYSDVNNLTTINNNLMVVASSSYSKPMIINKPQQTLTLFPEKAPYFPIPPYGEIINNFNANMYEFQLQTGEIDLELRLG